MKKWLVFAIVVLALVTLVAGCTKAAPTPTSAPTATPVPAAAATPTARPTTPAAPAKVYELNFMTATTTTSHPFLADWIKEIEGKSQGRIKIKLFQTGEHPYQWGDMLRAVRERGTDIGFQMDSYNVAAEPIQRIMDLPMLLSGGPPEFMELMSSPLGADIKRVSFDDVFDKWNQVMVTYGTGSTGLFIGVNDRFVTGFDSLQGKKIRTYNKSSDQFISALKGTPTSITWTETYPALQRGVVEGLLTGLASAYRAKFFEVGGRYVTLASYNSGLYILTMNKDALRELPADLQAVVMDVGKEFPKHIYDFYRTDVALSGYAGVNEYGLRIMAMPTAFAEEVRKVLKPSWDEWAKEMGAVGADLLQKADAFHAAFAKSK